MIFSVADVRVEFFHNKIEEVVVTWILPRDHLQLIPSKALPNMQHGPHAYVVMTYVIFEMSVESSTSGSSSTVVGKARVARLVGVEETVHVVMHHLDVLPEVLIWNRQWLQIGEVVVFADRGRVVSPHGVDHTLRHFGGGLGYHVDKGHSPDGGSKLLSSGVLYQRRLEVEGSLSNSHECKIERHW